MASDEPFTAFNKPPKDPQVLIGNYVEERALKEATGVSRYEPWVDTEEVGPNTSIYNTTRAKISQIDTFPRVVEHIHQMAPGNWKSMYGASYRAPQDNQLLMEYKGTDTLGPRAKKDLELMKSMAADLAPDVQTSVTCQGHTTDMQTTYRDHYVPKDMTVNTIGARAMKDRDGRPAVRDPTFLSETQLVPKHLADRVFGETAKRAGAIQTTLLPNPDIAVTVYSEAVAARKYGSNIYGTRPIAGSQPFNKFTNFSKPMSEYSKVVIDE